jgi:hypothetical protein
VEVAVWVAVLAVGVAVPAVVVAVPDAEVTVAAAVCDGVAVAPLGVPGVADAPTVVVWDGVRDADAEPPGDAVGVLEGEGEAVDPTADALGLAEETAVDEAVAEGVPGVGDEDGVGVRVGVGVGVQGTGVCVVVGVEVTGVAVRVAATTGSDEAPAQGRDVAPVSPSLERIAPAKSAAPSAQRSTDSNHRLRRASVMAGTNGRPQRLRSR